MRGEKRKLIAIVMAIALVVAGFYAMPTKSINATTSEIAVTGVPSGAWGGKKNKYQLGTTSDTSADGKWYLEVSQNQWGNWEGSYQNADAIEGFIFNNKTYNNAGGIFLWSADLKSEYNLTAGQSYTMSVTINYQNVNAAQHNYILTEGGNKNLSDSRTVAAGNSTETYSAVVTPTAADDFILRISWTSIRYETAEKAKITVSDVTFSDPPTTTEGPTTTAAVGDWLNVGTTGSKYRLGVGYDSAANGKWYLEVAQNQWTNWHGRYKYADRIEGFVFDDQVYNNRGGVYLTSTDLKSEFNLTPGTTYNMSVTLNYTGVNAAQHNFIFTEGGSTNMDTTRTVAAGDSSETYTATVTPTAADDFVLRISWASVAHETAELAMIEVADVTFTEQATTIEPGYKNCTRGDWAFADDPGTSGWQYFVHSNSIGSIYSGGTDIGTPLVIKYGTYVPDADHSCMARSPITTVTPGAECEGTISVTSTAAIGASGDQVVGASVYSYNASTGAYDWLANATEAKTNVVANQKTTFHLEYTAPETGKIIYIITTDYTPVATLTFEATHSEETPTTPTTTVEPGYSAATLGDWTFADAPGTSGWQYFIHSNSTGSTYKGGTGMNDPLFIKYGTYVPDADHSCMARSPITTVTPGSNCSGTISITSSENIGASGDQVVGASVYSYNASTGAYDWLANATEAKTNVVADQKTTFHLNYTAPDTGKIIYILTTDYTPVATLKFETSHSEETTTTTAAPTTTAGDWIDVPDATVTTVGAWKLFANYAEWAQLQYKNSKATPTDMSDTSIRVKNPTGWYNWNCTAKLENFCRTEGMVYGTPYEITINVNSSLPTAQGSTIKVAIDNVVYYFELDAGNNALVIDNFTYFGEYETSDVVFDLSLLQQGTVLNFSSIDVVANPDESTSQETTTPAPIVDPDITLTGYQINTTSEGFRMVGQVEPQINGSNVTEYGFVYGLYKIYKPATDSFQDTGITDDDMTIDEKQAGSPAAKYVTYYASTSAGIIPNQMGNSSTATYFARTMTFGKKNKAAFTSKYKVRVYAKLANGNTVYSDEVFNFSVFDIVKPLYEGCLMNTLAKHEYLYNTILTKVDEDYAEVPYEYGHTIAVPGEKNS